MTGRHFPSDLRPLDHNHIQIVARAACDIVGTIVIRRQVGLVRLVFDVVRDGNGVETFPPRFFRPHCRPNAAVRKHRVNVKVTFERNETGHIRNVDRRACASDGLMGRTGLNHQRNKRDQTESSFHLMGWSVVADQPQRNCAHVTFEYRF